MPAKLTEIEEKKIIKAWKKEKNPIMTQFCKKIGHSGKTIRPILDKYCVMRKRGRGCNTVPLLQKDSTVAPKIIDAWNNMTEPTMGKVKQLTGYCRETIKQALINAGIDVKRKNYSLPKEKQDKIVTIWKELSYPTLAEVATKTGHAKHTIAKILHNNNIDINYMPHMVRRYRATYNLHKECETLLEEMYGTNRVSSKAYQEIKLPTKIIIADDLHIPDINWDCVNKMLEQDGDADGILTGEMINFDSFSTYPKYHKSNPTKEDNIAAQLVNIFMNHFKWGFIIETNHTARVRKFLSKVTNEVQLEYFRKQLTEGLPFFTKVNSKMPFINQPIVQVGQLVYSHFSEYSSVTGRTPQQVLQKLNNYGDAYGLKEPYNALAIGHTHNQCQLWYQQKYLAEVGCMCHLSEYIFNSSSAGMRNSRWINGYLVVYLNKDGSVDFNKTQTKFLGFAKERTIETKE